ncbi:MAG: SDR family NAD(P)-dependent oxidoreductase [Fluviicoccus sp.]|uniref:SDR family NAD(P)-dependent oxidoreductase n=1 Tax=Fluviicoccus sp. TaxID=2003552 RepID=UPI00271FF4A4|nr:SDR family NAD(P)-dependent oxidoreductase [Fluviicoccus sp.]MDO8330628.1 SDR family NAD(P)-dependent oxidoreductase [Fluviicoccus sp.]
MAKYDISNLTIAITGSTGGLGSALAKTLHAKGAKLALLDLDGAAAQQQAASLGGPSRAQGWAVNVRSMESLEQAINDAAAHFGGLDMVIANAGITEMEALVNGSEAAFTRVIDINLNGVWRTFKAAIPHVRQRRGYLLAISSMAAFIHSPLQSSYAASKAGVWAMCDSIRLELRHMGVGVGSVHPTFFPTPMMDGVFADEAGNRIWDGNKGGIWKMVTLESVVAAIVEGIEQRSDMIVVPKRIGLIARAPGVFRKAVEVLGFRDSEIEQAVTAAGRR